VPTTIAVNPEITPRKVRGAQTAIILGLFFGLSFAAVREMRVDCRDQVLGLNRGGALGLNADGAVPLNSQQCELDLGDVRVPLPAWALGIVPRLSPG
jgi:hypothetical protein